MQGSRSKVKTGERLIQEQGTRLRQKTGDDGMKVERALKIEVGLMGKEWKLGKEDQGPKSFLVLGPPSLFMPYVLP